MLGYSTISEHLRILQNISRYLIIFIFSYVRILLLVSLGCILASKTLGMKSSTHSMFNVLLNKLGCRTVCIQVFYRISITPYCIYFFLRTYSTFGFSWMHSSIQDTWYDKCCSFDVQGANEWPEWQTKLLAHFNDWTDRLVQCLPSRSGSDSSAALHSSRSVGWEIFQFCCLFLFQLAASL